MPSAFRSATALILPLGLAACGHKDAGNATAMTNAPAFSVPDALSATGPAKAALTLADGPDACFRAIAKQIGADTKVSEINAFYSVGKDIDAETITDRPAGQLTTCSVQYQSPTDPRKLVETSMDAATGAFEAPHPVEITVMGGDEAKFKLDDYLIPLSRVNAAGLTSVMDAEKPKLAGYYGKYAWSGVRLEAPDAFSGTHTLRLDVDGRLKANDIKKGGYASVSLDGRTVTKDFLTS